MDRSRKLVGLQSPAACATRAVGHSDPSFENCGLSHAHRTRRLRSFVAGRIGVSFLDEVQECICWLCWYSSRWHLWGGKITKQARPQQKAPIPRQHHPAPSASQLVARSPAQALLPQQRNAARQRHQQRFRFVVQLPPPLCPLKGYLRVGSHMVELAAAHEVHELSLRAEKYLSRFISTAKISPRTMREAHAKSSMGSSSKAYTPLLSTPTSRATHAHPTSPRSTGFCAIWGCISSSSLLRSGKK